MKKLFVVFVLGVSVLGSIIGVKGFIEANSMKQQYLQEMENVSDQICDVVEKRSHYEWETIFNQDEVDELEAKLAKHNNK